jgi:hypothetical protein
MYKIVLTTDLRRRMADLQTANPLPLHLEGMAIHLSVAGAQRHEVALHRKYRRYHVRGEWYHLPAPVLTGTHRCQDLDRCPHCRRAA